MKKAIGLLLALALVFAFALVACGDEATETEDGTDTEAAETTDGAIDWTEAVDYEGEEVTVTGTVAAVTDLYEEKGIAKYLLRLGGDATQDHFNVTFVMDPETGEWPDYLADWESTVDSMVGKTVEVTGIVSLNQFEACYEIRVNDLDDNTMPDEEGMSATVVVVE